MDNTSNIKNITDLYLRKMKTISIDGRDITGLSSGIEELDKITHGFQDVHVGVFDVRYFVIFGKQASMFHMLLLGFDNQRLVDS